LRQFVAQGPRTDTQAFRRFFAAAVLSAQGVDDYLELATPQVITQRPDSFANLVV
jgi:hypothetical protein